MNYIVCDKIVACDRDYNKIYDVDLYNINKFLKNKKYDFYFLKEVESKKEEILDFWQKKHYDSYVDYIDIHNIIKFCEVDDYFIIVEKIDCLYISEQLELQDFFDKNKELFYQKNKNNLVLKCFNEYFGSTEILDFIMSEFRG